MNKKLVIPVAIFSAVILSFLLINTTITGNFLFQGKKDTEQKTVKQITITRDNLNLYMQEQQIVKDLPKKAKIGFQFYRFENGERVWEEKYIVEKGSVQRSDFNPDEMDLVVIMHSRNLQNLGDFCNMIKVAKQNGDLAYETKIGSASFLWKYKGMMGYRDCFGM